MRLNKILMAGLVAAALALPLAARADQTAAASPSPQPAATPALRTTPDPDFASALDLYYKEQWPDAQAAFQKILTRDPLDSMALDYLITTYIKRNDLRTILYQVEQKTVATNDKDPVALAHLGWGYLARSMKEPNMLDEAQRTFEKALNLDPNLSIAHCGLGLVYYQRRFMPRAKGHFILALKNNPNDLMALERIGDITMVDEKHPDEALPFFEKETRRAPNYPDGYWYVGSAYFSMGRLDRCIEFMKKCAALDPFGLTQGYHAPMLMGKAYLKLKDYTNAKIAFQDALKLNPNNPEAQYYLSVVEHPPKDGAAPKKP